MRAVIQRVKSCSVDIAGQTVGSIGAGMLILLGVEAADTAEDIDWLVGKISRPMYEQFVAKLSQTLGTDVPTGEFGADMQVSLVNDGPVTICINTKNKE